MRHGQTDWNVGLRLQGSSDIPLNDTGRSQAVEAAGLLSGAAWDRVVTSPLSRANETGRIIADILQLAAPTTQPDLVERAYGEAEGLTKEEAIDRFGTNWPGQETYAALTERAHRAVNSVAAANLDTALIVVTHGTFIRAFTDWVTGEVTVTPDNAHAVWFTGEPGKWRVTQGLRLAAQE